MALLLIAYAALALAVNWAIYSNVIRSQRQFNAKETNHEKQD